MTAINVHLILDVLFKIRMVFIIAYLSGIVVNEYSELLVRLKDSSIAPLTLHASLTSVRNRYR